VVAIGMMAAATPFSSIADSFYIHSHNVFTSVPQSLQLVHILLFRTVRAYTLRKVKVVVLH